MRLTQQDMADRLGLKRNTIATYEIGKAQPSDRTIADICREFNINEAWLRTGEGEMRQPVTRDQAITDFMADILKGEPDFRTRLVSVMARLTEEEWRMLERRAQDLMTELAPPARPVSADEEPGMNIQVDLNDVL